MLTDPLLSDSSLSEFERVLEYCFGKQSDDALPPSLPTSSRVTKEQLSLMFVCMTGMMLYYQLSVDFADEHYQNYVDFFDGDRKEAEKYRDLFTAFTVFSVCSTSVAVLKNSTDRFLEYWRRSFTPDELENALTPQLTPQQQILRNIFFAAGAIISAVPLSVVGAYYPPAFLPPWARGLNVAFIGLDNSVLHFLPMMLAWEEPLYRLPALPFEWVYQWLKERHLSEEQRIQLDTQNQISNAYNERLKAPLIHALTQAQTGLTIQTVSMGRDDSSFLLSVRITLPEQLARENYKNLSALERLSAYIEYGNSIPPASQHNPTLQIVVGLIGTASLPIGCYGYLAFPVLAMITLTHSIIAGIGLTAVPTYLFGVLLAFYGKVSLLNFFNYMTEWGPGDAKLPLQYKLNPLMASLYSTGLVLISTVVFAAGVALIETVLSPKNSMHPVLIDFAITSLTFLAFTAMIEFYCTLAKHFHLYGQKNDRQLVTQHIEVLEEAKHWIRQMKDEALYNGLAQLEDTALNRLGFTRDYLNNFKTEIDKLQNMNPLDFPDNRMMETEDEDMEKSDDEASYLPLVVKGQNKSYSTTPRNSNNSSSFSFLHFNISLVCCSKKSPSNNSSVVPSPTKPSFKRNQIV